MRQATPSLYVNARRPAGIRQLNADVSVQQELVGSSIIRNMDERIEKLENALALIVERSKLQLDLDYATRTVSPCWSLTI